MATTFGTLESAERLKAGGFTEQQARAATEAFAKATGQELATKADLDGLRRDLKADLDELRLATRVDIDELRHATKADIDELRHATKADIDELRHATKADIDGLRVELYREMRELAWKMGGLLLAQGAAIVALVKLLPGHG
jgi:transcriptional regulator of met regulon